MKQAIRLALFLVLFSLPILGQSTLTATITDSDGTPWASLAGYNATYTITLVSSTGAPIPAGQAYQKDTGATVVNPSPGTMDATGTFSVALASSSNITPSGTQWKFVLCSAVVSSPCNTVTLPINASGNYSTQLSTGAVGPRVGGGVGSYAYSDLEVTSIANNSYFNITTSLLRCYGSSWEACGTDAGTGFPITIGMTQIGSGSNTPSISGLALVSPNLGTPTALTLTNATGLPWTGLTGSPSIAQVPFRSLTTTGTGGATLNGTTGVLNIPIPAGSVSSGLLGSPAFYTANGTNLGGTTPFNGLSWFSTGSAPRVAVSSDVQSVIGAGVYAPASVAGTVTSVSGTASQIDVATGTTTPVISLDSAFITAGGALTGTQPNPQLVSQFVAQVSASQKNGSADAVTPLQACLTAAATSPYPECYIPAGTYKVASGLTCSSAVSCKIKGAGSDVTSITASGTGYNTLVVGNGAGNQAIPTGYTTGLHLIGAIVPGSPTGISALQINGMNEYRVDDVSVTTDDIGVDLINNNYGTQFTNLRACFGSNCNVGVNLRTGSQSGSDISFFNCWVGGIVAGYSMSGGGGGYHLYGGQVGAGLLTGSGVDTSAGIVFGRDYLSPSTLGEVTFDVNGTSFEGVNHAWVFRGFNQVHLITTGVAANPATSSAPAIGFYKNSQANNSNVQFDGTVLSGYWGPTLISDTTVYANDEFFENGTYSAAQNPYINGTQTYITSMAQQSNIPYATVTSSTGAYSYNVITTRTGTTPSTSVVCPNGPGGALSTSGCVASGTLPTGTQGEPLVNTSGAATYATSQVFIDATQFTGGVAEKINACVTAAIAIGGVCDARGMGSPIVVANGIANPITTDEEIDVGDSSGDPVTLLLPASFYWVGGMTDGTSCTLKQYANTSIIGQGTPSGNAGVFGAANTSNLGYVYCNYAINLTYGANYFYAFGFSIFNNNNSAQFQGAVTANNVGSFISGPTYDNSHWDHMLFLDAMDTYDVEITGLCCTAAFTNSSFNTNYHGIPLYIYADFGGTYPNGNIGFVDFINDSIVHNLAGSPLVLYTDAGNNGSSVNFTDIYSEVKGDSTGIVQLNGPGKVSVTNWQFNAEDSSAPTSPLFEISSATNTAFTATNITASNGSGTFTYPVTCIQDNYSSQTITCPWESNRAALPYWSSLPINSAAFGTSSQLSIANSGAITNSSKYNNLYIGYFGTHNVQAGVDNLTSVTTGQSNESFGESGENVSSGSYNTSFGQYALGATTSNDSTAFGYQALERVTTGADNTAFGYDAGQNGTTMVTNSQSTFVGSGANASANALSNDLVLGYNAQATASNQIVLGNSSITGLIVQGVTSGTATGEMIFPVSKGYVECTQANCATTATTLATAPGVSGGLWHADLLVNCTAAVSTATVNVTITYTDTNNNTQTVTMPTSATCTTLASANAIASSSFNFNPKPTTVVQYNAVTTNSPTGYTARVNFLQESTN